MITYPDRAAPALVRLFRRFNDITIFGEDATYTNMYRAYFERILEGRARLKKIFPLSGRARVIEAASGNKFRRYAPCIFIIDGDIDLLLGVAPPNINDLFRLSHYCAENLLICGIAAVELGFESSPDNSRQTVRKAIAFERWRNRVVSMLFPLFVKYAVAHRVGIPAPTTSYHVQQLCEGKTPNRALSKAKIEARIAEIEGEILKKVRKYQMKGMEKTIKATAQRGASNRIRYISGKTYRNCSSGVWRLLI